MRPLTGYVNDPNGPAQVGDTWHLFCQHNPNSAVHGTVHWAHFTSTDLVRWQEHPPALVPEPGGADADGCWSGSTAVVDGTPWLVYSGYHVDATHQVVCLARPGPVPGRWVKDPAVPVITGPPQGLGVTVFRDPFVWPEDGGWALAIGAGLADGTGAVLLYRSPDLRSWTYAGPLVTGSAPVFDGVRTGVAWECPQLARLGGRTLLVASAWYPSHIERAFFVTGTRLGDRLEPALVGGLDAGPDLYAPAMTTDRQGRVLLWGWSWELRSPEAVLLEGWAGVLTLPRVVTLAPDGSPRLAPAPELDALRGRERRWEARAGDGEERVLDAAAGDAYEVVATLETERPGRAELRLRLAPGAAEHVAVGIDTATGDAYLCRDRASLDPRAPGGTFRVAVGARPGRPVQLRVYLDRSLVEVFAGDGRTITARVYPTRGDSLGLALRAEGSAAAATVRSWAMPESVVGATPGAEGADGKPGDTVGGSS